MEFSLWLIFRRFRRQFRVLFYLWIAWAVIMVAINLTKRVHPSQSRSQHVNTVHPLSHHAHA
jgi:hypothetical protein